MHVYLHVPFCARRCSYCDFAIAVRKEVPSETYVTAVLSEWALWQEDEHWHESPEIRTIYFGGGTPSRIAPDAVGRILDRLAHDRQVEAGAEITLEANPDDVTLEAARAWRTGGVNRISLGVQSFDPNVLRWMHRVHTVDQIFRAVEAVRNAGFGDLSVDLIFGLPRSQNRNWAFDLDQAFSLDPEHVSLYGLTLEAHTPLGHWASRGEVTPVDDETYATEFLESHAALEARGYDHYEVSNAGRPGHRARHNSAYWQRAPFIGLGPSAHSGLGSERRWNVREWAAYQRLVLSGRSPVEATERLDDEAIALEELYLGLRTTDGLPAQRVTESERRRWAEEGWAAPGTGRLRLTPEGWLRLDALVASIALPSRLPPLDSQYADARSAD